MVYKTFQTKLPVLPNLGIIGQTLFNYGFMVYAAINGRHCCITRSTTPRTGF